jgi:hypothetical protein
MFTPASLRAASFMMQAPLVRYAEVVPVVAQSHRAPFHDSSISLLRRVADLSVARMTQGGTIRSVIHRPPLRLAGFLTQMSE